MHTVWAEIAVTSIGRGSLLMSIHLLYLEYFLRKKKKNDDLVEEKAAYLLSSFKYSGTLWTIVVKLYRLLNQRQSQRWPQVCR